MIMLLMMIMMMMLIVRIIMNNTDSNMINEIDAQQLDRSNTQRLEARELDCLSSPQGIPTYTPRDFIKVIQDYRT